MTISCFCTFLIFIQSYTSIFAFILNAFFLLVSVLFPLQVYVQEAGEGTSPILSFLHPFVMSWNKLLRNSAEKGTLCIIAKQQERHRIALTYMFILFCHCDHCLINTIILACFIYILNFEQRGKSILEN